MLYIIWLDHYVYILQGDSDPIPPTVAAETFEDSQRFTSEASGSDEDEDVRPVLPKKSIGKSHLPPSIIHIDDLTLQPDDDDDLTQQPDDDDDLTLPQTLATGDFVIPASQIYTGDLVSDGEDICK